MFSFGESSVNVDRCINRADTALYNTVAITVGVGAPCIVAIVIAVLIYRYKLRMNK